MKTFRPWAKGFLAIFTDDDIVKIQLLGPKPGNRQLLCDRTSCYCFVEDLAPITGCFKYPFSKAVGWILMSDDLDLHQVESANQRATAAVLTQNNALSATIAPTCTSRRIMVNVTVIHVMTNYHPLSS